MDLLVANSSELCGRVIFFEKMDDGTWRQNFNHNIPLLNIARGVEMPWLVDWDQDGDVDVLVGSKTASRSFERRSKTRLVEVANTDTFFVARSCLALSRVA